MKRLYLPVCSLALLLAFFGLAVTSGVYAAEGAHSFRLGNELVTYHTPQGFASLDPVAHAAVERAVKGALPGEMLVHALYVGTTAAAGQLPDDYLAVMSYQPLEQSEITVRDFLGLVAFVRNNQGLWSDAKSREYANESAARNGKGSPAAEGGRSLGSYGATETSVSYMAIIGQPLSQGDASSLRDYLLVSTGLLVQGKVLVVNQYHRLTRADEVFSFRDAADSTVASMRFRLEGAPEPIVSEGAPQNESQSDYRRESSLFVNTGTILAMLVLAAVFVLYRRRKRFMKKKDVEDVRKGE